MPSQLDASSDTHAARNVILQQIINSVQSRRLNVSNLGLYNGLAGDLLFLWQTNKLQNVMVDEAKFLQKLEFLQSNIFNNLTNISFGNGLSGLGWLVEYLNQQQGNDYDPSFCEDIDQLLFNSINTDKWHGEIELVTGLAGIAAYLSRRQVKTLLPEFSDKLVSHYEELATQFSDNQITWYQPKNSRYRIDKDDTTRSEINLGLAHGIAGIIAALLPFLTDSELNQRVARLLTLSCDWLIQQSFPDKNHESIYPNAYQHTKSSRLGWCYGDLTIALTLARVGKALDKVNYLDRALEISLHATTRNQVSGMVHDAGLCHGSAGLALIFQLLNSVFSHDKLIQSSQKWLSITFNQYHKKQLSGFNKYSIADREHIVSKGFLEGYSGVGLSIQAAINNDTSWCDSLLLS